MSAQGFFRAQGGSAALSSVSLTTFYYNTPRRLVLYRLWWWKTTTLPMDDGEVTLDQGRQLSRNGEYVWGFWTDDLTPVALDVIEDRCINHFLSVVMNGKHVPFAKLNAQEPDTISGHRVRRMKMSDRRVADIVVHGLTHRELYQRSGSGVLTPSHPRLVYHASVREAKGWVDGEVIELNVTAPTGELVVDNVPFADSGTLTGAAVNDYLVRVNTSIPG